MHSFDLSLGVFLLVIGLASIYAIFSGKKVIPLVGQSTNALRSQYIHERERMELVIFEIKKSLDELSVRMCGIETGTSEIPFPRWTISLEGKYLS